MASNNIYSQGYAAIWNALNAWEAFTAIVRPGPGTQVNMQANGFVPPSNANAGDRPSVRLGQNSVTAKPYDLNSLMIGLDAAYAIEVDSGEFGIDRINLLMNVVLQALTAAGNNLGLASIYRWKIGTMSVRAIDQANGRPEWTSVGAVNVTFAVFRTDYVASAFT